MALWSATKKIRSSDLESVGQGHYLKKIAASHYMTYFFLNFYGNDDNVVTTKHSHQLTLKM